jgi:hypothetical protein
VMQLNLNRLPHVAIHVAGFSGEHGGMAWLGVVPKSILCSAKNHLPGCTRKKCLCQSNGLCRTDRIHKERCILPTSSKSGRP